jgi:hypothetical protein
MARRGLYWRLYRLHLLGGDGEQENVAAGSEPSYDPDSAPQSRAGR